MAASTSSSSASSSSSSPSSSSTNVASGSSSGSKHTSPPSSPPRSPTDVATSSSLSSLRSAASSSQSHSSPRSSPTLLTSPTSFTLPDHASDTELSPSYRRPQAPPLPKKRGEIGFQEGVDDTNGIVSSETEEVSLPARHPADRDHASAPSSSSNPTSSADADTSSTNTTAAPSSSSSSTSPCKILFFQRLKPKKVPTIGGLHLSTLLALLFQLCLLAGTIVGWVMCATYVMNGGNFGLGTPSSSNDNNSNNGSGGDTSNNSSQSGVPVSSSIFIHIVFGIAVLAQLLFLERRVYRLRAERYAYLHPGEILPSHRSGASARAANPFIAISPWNRPPLPTYAATIAQTAIANGVGTGDVEDQIIVAAGPPPPAYGNTRGSRLLLAGFLSDEVRAARPASVRSAHMAERERSGDSSRPVSYMSRDDEWEIIQDADRAMQLEATLGRLERTSSTSR